MFLVEYCVIIYSSNLWEISANMTKERCKKFAKMLGLFGYLLSDRCLVRLK